MLKKTLKKILAVALTVAAVATTLAVPVSAATLKPKKSHKDSEVQEKVLYLIDAADEIAISPYSGFAGDFGTSLRASFERRHKFHSYRGYQMCEMLLATPNLKSACSPETISELKKARNTWKSAYISDMMYAFYGQVWYDTYCISEDKYASYITYKNQYLSNRNVKGNIIIPRLYPDKMLKKATESYNRVKKYIAKYKKYNPTAAAKITKWNTTQYNAYKKLAPKLKGFKEAQYLKGSKKTGGVGSVFEVAQAYYKIDMGIYGELDEESKLDTKISTWYWNDMGMTPFNGDKNSPHKVFMRNTRYTEW